MVNREQKGDVQYDVKIKGTLHEQSNCETPYHKTTKVIVPGKLESRLSEVFDLQLGAYVMSEPTPPAREVRVLTSSQNSQGNDTIISKCIFDNYQCMRWPGGEEQGRETGTTRFLSFFFVIRLPPRYHSTSSNPISMCRRATFLYRKCDRNQETCGQKPFAFTALNVRKRSEP